MAYTVSQLQALKSEITNDPTAMGYTGKGDEEVAKLLNMEDAKHSVNVTRELATWQIFSKIDSAEYKAALLDPLKTSILSQVLAMGTVNPSDNNLRLALVEVFGNGSNTITNLAALRTRIGARVEVLGLPKATPSDVANARKVS